MNNQILSIPNFPFAETCENINNTLLKDFDKPKTIKIFGFVIKKPKKVIETKIVVDPKIIRQKQIELQELNRKKNLSGFNDWINNIHKYSQEIKY